MQDPPSRDRGQAAPEAEGAPAARGEGSGMGVDRPGRHTLRRVCLLCRPCQKSRGVGPPDRAKRLEPCAANNLRPRRRPADGLPGTPVTESLVDALGAGR